MSAMPAMAGELLPKSIICRKESSIRKIAKVGNEQVVASLRDCYHAKTITKIERLSCEADICKIKLWKSPTDSYPAYTLRRYQP